MNGTTTSTSESVLKRYYREACRPFNVTKWSHLIITILFFGIGMGTVAYGYIGTIINVLLMFVFLYIKLLGSRLIKESSLNKSIFLLSAGFDIYFSFLFLNGGMFMANIFTNVQMEIKDIDSIGNLVIAIAFITLLFLVTYIYLKHVTRLDIDQIGKLEKNKIIKTLSLVSVSSGSLLGIFIGRMFGGSKFVIIFTCILCALLAQVFITLASFYTVIFVKNSAIRE